MNTTGTQKVFLEPSINKGQRYRVLHEGSVLIEDTSNPEYEACRALLAKGNTGKLETWRTDKPYPCMRLDIEKAAKLTIRENDRRGPERRPYDAFQNSSVYVRVDGNFPREALAGTPHA